MRGAYTEGGDDVVPQGVARFVSEHGPRRVDCQECFVTRYGHGDWTLHRSRISPRLRRSRTERRAGSSSPPPTNPTLNLGMSQTRFTRRRLFP